MNNPFGKCTWCQAEYKYSPDFDEFESNDGGDLDTAFVEVPNHDCKLQVTFCRCGGVLAVHTDEANGSEVLVGVSSNMEM